MLNIARHGGFALLVLAVAGLAVWLWLLGGSARIAIWAASEQREVQNAMAQALRAVRVQEPWAVAGLLALCFGYGFLHAAGPGHGKLVMGGYALGEAVPRLRLVVLTLAGSLGQAVTAIVLVSLGALIFGWGRAQMTGWADNALAATSLGAIALVGVWLVWRGLKRWWQVSRDVAHRHLHDHDHDHGHDHESGVCDTCGHAHAPHPEDIAKATSLRDAAALVTAVAIRPCTGALFLLILTFSMGIAWVGILGALVMGLGTGVLTLAVALGASGLRSGLAARVSGTGGRQVMAGLEIVAGSAVALIAGQAALRLL